MPKNPQEMPYEEPVAVEKHSSGTEMFDAEGKVKFSFSPEEVGLMPESNHVTYSVKNGMIISAPGQIEERPDSSLKWGPQVFIGSNRQTGSGLYIQLSEDGLSAKLLMPQGHAGDDEIRYERAAATDKFILTSTRKYNFSTDKSKEGHSGCTRKHAIWELDHQMYVHGAGKTWVWDKDRFCLAKKETASGDEYTVLESVTPRAKETKQEEEMRLYVKLFNRLGFMPESYGLVGNLEVASPADSSLKNVEDNRERRRTYIGKNYEGAKMHLYMADEGLTALLNVDRAEGLDGGSGYGYGWEISFARTSSSDTFKVVSLKTHGWPSTPRVYDFLEGTCRDDYTNSKWEPLQAEERDRIQRQLLAKASYEKVSTSTPDEQIERDKRIITRAIHRGETSQLYQQIQELMELSKVSIDLQIEGAKTYSELQHRQFIGKSDLDILLEVKDFGYAGTNLYRETADASIEPEPFPAPNGYEWVPDEDDLTYWALRKIETPVVESSSDHETVSLDLIDALAQEVDSLAKQAAESIEKQPVSQRHLLAVRSTDPFTLSVLAHDETPMIKMLVACNLHTDAQVLDELASSGDNLIKIVVARNPNAQSTTLQRLLEEGNTEVIEAAKRNPNLPATYNFDTRRF